PVQFVQPVVQAPPVVSSWPKVVGILGIIFGAFGVLAGAQLMMMPNTMRSQKKMFSHMERMVETKSEEQPEAAPIIKGMFSGFNDMFGVPK
ncbi:MAG: hypothetical protein QGG25_15320, partial [Phycisphaerae bacterium]|nr:hypothetical protein [Phycisphaerae bacterium]